MFIKFIDVFAEKLENQANVRDDTASPDNESGAADQKNHLLFYI